jgi:threonine synthase
VPGPRSQAAAAAREAAARGAIYASHNYNPLCLAGWMTTAFEMWEQLGRAPDWVITPAGYGSNILSHAVGFGLLQASGLVDKLPRLVAVQARACAPLWARWHNGRHAQETVTEGETLAEGIRVIQPVRGEKVLAAIKASGGDVLAVAEADIPAGQAALARLGFYVEPTSAVVWPALEQISARAGEGETIVVLLTGNGLKSQPH